MENRILEFGIEAMDRIRNSRKTIVSQSQTYTNLNPRTSEIVWKIVLPGGELNLKVNSARLESCAT